MSECVVRMEMPKSCETCPACDYEEGNCLLADDRNTLPHNGKRRSWCPIVCALPENHGRLVDVDMVEKMLEDVQIISDGYGEYAGYCTEDVDMGIIPTIVPAKAESPSPKSTNPAPIHDVYYVMTKCDAETGTVTYEQREIGEE